MVRSHVHELGEHNLELLRADERLRELESQRAAEHAATAAAAALRAEGSASTQRRRGDLYARLSIVAAGAAVAVSILQTFHGG